MKTLQLAIALSMFGIIGFTTSNAQAQNPNAQAQNPNVGQPPAKALIYGGYYSNRLRGTFLHRNNFAIPGFPQFPGARVISLDPNSPLWALGIKPGDVISRLDQIRINDVGELERHHSNTEIRWIPTGTNSVRKRWVNLGPRNLGPLYPGPGGPGPGIAP